MSKESINSGNEWKAVCITCSRILGYSDTRQKARNIAIAHTQESGNEYHDVDVTHTQS